MWLANNLRRPSAYHDIPSLTHIQQFKSHLSLIYVGLGDVECSNIVRELRVKVKCKNHRDNALRLVKMVFLG